ncbi:10626_t:CDS:2, partial [Acaulospora colombiana]
MNGGALAVGAAAGATASSSSASLQNKQSTQDSTSNNGVERPSIPIAAPIASTAAIAAAASGGNAGTPPSAWLTSFDNYNAQNAAHTPSTLFSEPDSAFSTQRLQQPPLSPTGGNGRQNSGVQQQPRVDDYAVSPFADAFNNGAGPSATPRPSGPTRSNSLLKRFSAAITSPFTRSSNPRNSTGASGYHYHRNSLLLQQQNNPSSPVADGTGDANGNGANGYYRGMNHFNLGIPLNYRPVATAASPTSTDPAFGFARQQQQTLKTEYGGEVLSPTATANQRGSRAGMDDFAFSSYTQETRERLMGSRASPLSPPPTNRGSGDDRIAEEGSTDPRSDADDEKEEKIVEYDGSTVYGSINDREVGYTGGKRWSADHGTVVSRNGSQRAPSESVHQPESSQLSRRQSTRSGRSDGNVRQRSNVTVLAVSLFSLHTHCVQSKALPPVPGTGLSQPLTILIFMMRVFMVSRRLSLSFPTWKLCELSLPFGWSVAIVSSTYSLSTIVL